MPFKKVEVVEVLIWGKRAGACTLDPANGFYAFEYDPKFVKTAIELSPRQMPLSRARDPFVFTDLPEQTYRRLPAMLADALPDDFGNALINAYMATHGVTAEQVSPLDRLAYMGKRAFGALEFRPIRGPHQRSHSALDMSKLVEKARQAVRGELITDDHARAALTHIIQVGTSAGGARAKAAVAWNPKTKELRAGQFDVDQGFEHWLLKFDGIGKDNELGSSADYGHIEYAYSLMAGEVGLKMSPCRLLEESGRAHFMTKRFDRNGNQKLHMQSLCAMEHLDYKMKAAHSYEQLFLALAALKLDDAAKEQAFLRMALNVMAADCDDHTKNFSFLLEEGRTWRLAPAYDVTHAFNPAGEWTYQHLMSVNGKFRDIQRQDLLKVADRFEVPNAKRHLERIRDVVGRWQEFAMNAGVSKVEAAKVGADHRLL